ncbi:MAG TPA: cytochrome c-type biogenesis protein CcmH [Solirubrobacteraceae bacterium]|nr:cytochrome c-type biogenesis protein CcmH [Solirubrobacteraceae bacterium]
MTRAARQIAALALLTALMAGLQALAPAAASATPTPRASLTDIESDVMCTSCREPLEVAQSPQADSERAYIRMLIAQGETKQQIINNLVAQYGPSVLGKPPAHGFNLTVYILPPAILILGVAILFVTLPRWRRRTRAAVAQPPPDLKPLDPGEARRLDDDLARFGG